MHDWMARALPLALILLLVSALVAAASTDQSFVCTEPVSGDRYVYKEKSLPSLSTGLMTSTIVVSRLRNGTDDSSSSSSNLFQHLTGHIKFVYSQTFIILSEVLADVQGPYPLTSRDGSNSTNQLVHLVGEVSSPRFTTAYGMAPMAKPTLLAMSITEAGDFCCQGECELVVTENPSSSPVESVTPPATPAQPSAPPLPSATPEGSTPIVPEPMTCTDAAGGFAIQYGEQQLDDSLVVTLTRSPLSESSASPSRVRLLFSGVLWTGPLLNATLFEPTSRAVTVTSETFTSVYVSTTSMTSHIVLSYGTTNSTTQNASRPTLVGMALLPGNLCCYGSCGSMMVLQHKIRPKWPDGVLTDRRLCVAGGVAFNYTEKVLADDTNLVSYISLDNMTSTSTTDAVMEPPTVALQFNDSLAINALFSLSGTGADGVPLTTNVAGGGRSVVFTASVGLDALLSQSTFTPGFIASTTLRNATSTVGAPTAAPFLQSIKVNGQCCDGLCLEVDNGTSTTSSNLTVTTAGVTAPVVATSEEEEAVQELIDSATPAVATTLGASVVSSVATSMATTLATGTMTAGAGAATGGAGAAAGGMSGAGAGGGSGGTAQLIMSVQLFSALNYWQYMVRDLRSNPLSALCRITSLYVHVYVRTGHPRMPLFSSATPDTDVRALMRVRVCAWMLLLLLLLCCRLVFTTFPYAHINCTS